MILGLHILTGLTGLCRTSMHVFAGTLDALLCSKDAETNTHRMMSEISR